MLDTIQQGRILLGKKYLNVYFLVCKGLTIDDVEVSRDTVYDQEIRPGYGFETDDFGKDKLGGATVERLNDWQ